MVGHDGQGITRPGYAEVPIATMTPTVTRAIDMIPDNDVISLTADNWGVHIATATAPISSLERNIWIHGRWTQSIHYGRLSSSMVSNGLDLISLTNVGITYLAANGDHGVDDQIQVTNQYGAYIDSSGFANCRPRRPSFIQSDFSY